MTEINRFFLQFSQSFITKIYSLRLLIYLQFIAILVEHNKLSRSVVTNACQRRFGKRRYKSPQSLKGRHPNPSALVLQQSGKRRSQQGLSQLLRAHAGNVHDDFCTRFSYSPDFVLAQSEVAWQLQSCFCLRFWTRV